MLKNTRWTLKQSLAVVIASFMSVNAQSLPANLDAAIIASADKAAESAGQFVGYAQLGNMGPVYMPDAESIRNAILSAQYSMAVIQSDKEFDDSDKLNLPTAPKDSKGNYYLQLGSPHKVVSIPTPVGNIPVNMEALHYRSKLAELEMATQKASSASGKLAAKNLSYPVYAITISAVTSVPYWPNLENIAWFQNTATWDHGGAWVGAISYEWGAATSYSMTICGAPTTNWQTQIFYENGVPAGFWRANYAYGCQAGLIAVTATGAWGSVTDSVNFN